MFYRLTARVLLAWYGVIALWGQGLHEFLDDDGCCDQAQQSAPAAVASAEITAQVTLVGLSSQTGPALAVQSPSGHCHDCDNCPICQFQAVGQHFVPPPPAVAALVACEILSSSPVESIHCPALFSSAQPRAPPVA
ncbi:MAG TPA: hypothetical protein VMJ32_00590 [Pirellulales bacterium]|nr:hypothetical protein [Pirellulales bacterium]